MDESRDQRSGQRKESDHWDRPHHDRAVDHDRVEPGQVPVHPQLAGAPRQRVPGEDGRAQRHHRRHHRARPHVFLAEVESYGAGEQTEAISDILPTPVAEFERMIATGELKDGFLLAAYARAKARGLLRTAAVSEGGGG